jgi:mannose-1-phosphate guanylyltransferase
MRRVAVVLAGGSGERFWPLSRKSKPKQFLRLAPERATLLEETIGRLLKVLPAGDIYVVTGSHLVEQTLAATPMLPVKNIISEPAKKNTAGAIVYGFSRIGGDVSMGVFPADHTVEDVDSFLQVVRNAYEHAERSQELVTVGLKPTRPETAYGYIEVGSDTSTANASKVKAFHEKPDAVTAEAYVAGGRHLWNSGMFFWTAQTFFEELAKADPSYASTACSLAENPGIFEHLRSISIDHLLLERSSNVAVVPGDFEWDDVGSLDALARFTPPDGLGNTIRGEAVLVDSSSNLVINEVEGTALCVIGVSDLIVVNTGDAVLVCHKDKVQELRQAVEEMTKRGLPQV